MPHYAPPETEQEPHTDSYAPAGHHAPTFGSKAPLFWSLAAFTLALMATLLTLFPEAGLALRARLNPPEVKPHTGIVTPDTHVPATPVNANPITKPFASLIADVAQNMAPSVVNIDVQIERRPTPQQVPDVFRYFFGVEDMPPPQPYQQTGQGSGFIYDAAKGIVITNNHVVAGANTIQVTLDDGSKHEATLLGGDSLTDLAVLKLKDLDKAPPLKAARVGDSERLRPGDWVLAIGSPLGFDHSVTLGIVSAISRYVPGLNEDVKFIQTDAAINPGNSGGPLVNIYGEVVGVNTAIAGKGQNIGFSIPSTSMRNIVDELILNGAIERPYVGLALDEVNPTLLESLGYPNGTEGVIVVEVAFGSPAAMAGLRQGDVVQRVNGTPVKSPKALQESVRSQPIGTEFTLQVLRGNRMMGVKLKSAKMEQQAPPA
jgi:serine protease Do